MISACYLDPYNYTTSSHGRCLLPGATRQAFAIAGITADRGFFCTIRPFQPPSTLYYQESSSVNKDCKQAVRVRDHNPDKLVDGSGWQVPDRQRERERRRVLCEMRVLYQAEHEDQTERMAYCLILLLELRNLLAANSHSFLVKV